MLGQVVLSAESLAAQFTAVRLDAAVDLLVSRLFLIPPEHFPTAMIVTDEPFGRALPLTERVTLVDELGESVPERPIIELVEEGVGGL